MPLFIVRSDPPFQQQKSSPVPVGSEIQPGYVVTEVFDRRAPSGFPAYWHRVRSNRPKELHPTLWDHLES